MKDPEKLQTPQLSLVQILFRGAEQRETILGSECYTTKYDFQCFISTFLFKLYLLPQMLSSIEGKGNIISSFKTEMVLQKKNSQNLQTFLEFSMETNLYLTCPIADIPKSLPGNNSLQIFTLNKCKALELMQVPLFWHTLIWKG